MMHIEFSLDTNNFDIAPSSCHQNFFQGQALRLMRAIVQPPGSRMVGQAQKREVLLVDNA
jgi:hypothetical protein